MRLCRTKSREPNRLHGRGTDTVGPLAVTSSKSPALASEQRLEPLSNSASPSRVAVVDGVRLDLDSTIPSSLNIRLATDMGIRRGFSLLAFGDLR